MHAHILQHVAFEGPGSIAAWLEMAGCDIGCTRFHDGEALPDPATVDLLVVMGGPMSVNDEAEFPWLAEETRFVGDIIRRGRPVLGVCLGAQLIASALGARVFPNASARSAGFRWRRWRTAIRRCSAFRRRSRSSTGMAKPSTCRTARCASRAVPPATTRLSSSARR